MKKLLIICLLLSGCEDFEDAVAAHEESQQEIVTEIIEDDKYQVLPFSDGGWQMMTDGYYHFWSDGSEIRTTPYFYSDIECTYPLAEYGTFTNELIEYNQHGFHLMDGREGYAGEVYYKDGECTLHGWMATGFFPTKVVDHLYFVTVKDGRLYLN